MKYRRKADKAGGREFFLRGKKKIDIFHTQKGRKCRFSQREKWEEEVHSGIMTLNKGVRKGGDVVVFIRSKYMDWDQ